MQWTVRIMVCAVVFMVLDRTLMCDVLFCYARAHKDIGYRQVGVSPALLFSLACRQIE